MKTQPKSNASKMLYKLHMGLQKAACCFHSMLTILTLITINISLHVYVSYTYMERTSDLIFTQVCKEIYLAEVK
jgi:hypothetical protein